MKKVLFAACLVATLAQVLSAQAAAPATAGKVLYVYDQVNDKATPYIGHFEASLAAEGIAFDEATAAQAATMDLSSYRVILVHGMVMAFATSSPVRDWLKAEKRLGGKRVALFVTANRWSLDKLYKQLVDLLKKDRAEPVDAISTATKSLDADAKAAAVRSFVARLK
jgi:hypothetical protein